MFSRLSRRLGVGVALALLVGAVSIAQFVRAQDAMAKVTCDSSLVVLLLVAEHDYDYLSHLMMDETMMDHPALKIDKGQYGPLIDSIVAMMTAMMEEDPNMVMTEEEMMAHDEMLNNMMGMGSTADMVAAYMASMNMEMGDMMTTLQPGNVAGEDPVCAEVRADVEKFIIAHIVTEISMMGMEGQ